MFEALPHSCRGFVSDFGFRISSFSLLVLLCLAGLPAAAHELRPAYLELHEETTGEFRVLWKTPMRGDLRLALSPEFSSRMENLTLPATRRTGNAAVQTWRLKAVEPMRGQSVRITGLESTMTDTLARIEFADGTVWTQRLTPGQPAATIPVRESGLMVAGVYLKLGVEHILGGVDHLLFVLALLIMTCGMSLTPALSASGGGKVSEPRARGMWRLVKTVTAFTLAHSITLGLATLGFVRVPSAPVEAVIALSIVFVATEIPRLPLTPSDRERVAARPGEGKGSVPSITARAPWVVAFTFGLLHGFGFAGALSEIGLPEGQIPVALLFFNLGVEAGQLLFVAAVLAAMAVGRLVVHRFHLSTLNPQLSTVLRLIPPYAIGSVAMFWVIQRVAAF
jgi:hypothetical protein